MNKSFVWLRHINLAVSGLSIYSRTAILLSFLLINATAAQEYTSQRISEPETVNRTPVISETGLVTWHGYKLTELGQAMSDVYIYNKGTVTKVTKEAASPEAAEVNPAIHSNLVVWTASLEPPVGNYTWSLKQVPPDTNAPPELMAAYKANCEQDGHGGSMGRQWFDGPETNVDVSASTNQNTTHRAPSGNNEICLWRIGGETTRITRDNRNDIAPSCWGNLIAWQKAKGWPFGWEIMVAQGDFRNQLTTNFVYDMAPQVSESFVTWYGWDGNDYEIFLYNQDDKSIVQITSNRFDDVGPVIDGQVIAWEAYPAVEADIFMWRNGEIRKLSSNVEDDLNPRVWNNKVVWQGFDGEDFEIYFFDGEKTIKFTDNEFDDVDPDIKDDYICWAGYHENWDAEIFVQKIGSSEPTRLSENDIEDRVPRTAKGQVVWEAKEEDTPQIYLATPE
jgi:hypothetical protein